MDLLPFCSAYNTLSFLLDEVQRITYVGNASASANV